MKKIKFFDTFAWIWGFHLALEKAIWKENIELIWFSEIDKYAEQTYLKNFEWAKNFWDITQINIQNLPDFDLLTGWFPCQDVSVAGKQDLSWWRTILVEYLLKILEEKKPEYFVFENVKGLLNEKFKDFRESIFQRIENAWYWFKFQVLNTKDYWLPQNRERVVIVWKKTWINDFIFPEKEELKIFLKDILQNIEFKKLPNWVEWFYWKTKRIDVLKTINDKYSFTLSTWKTHNKMFLLNENKTLWRRFSSFERERLQWFPDYWTYWVSDQQRCHQLWNAISVPVFEKVFINLLK